MNDGKHSLTRVEFIFLSLMIALLPVSEAGKNIFSLLFFLSWFWFWGKDKNARIAWGGWDWLIIAFILSSLLSTALAFDFGHQWPDFLDIFASLSLAWMLMHSRLSERQIYTLFIAIIIPTFFVALWGAWEWAILHKKVFFELGSVGHTNQSSTFVAMVASLCFWLVLLFHNRLNRFVLAGLLLVLLALFTLVTWGESRATLLAFGILVIILGIYFCFFKRIDFGKAGVGFLGLLFLFSCFLALNPYLINKTLSNMQSPAGIDSYRSGIREVSLEIFKHYPVFGVGVSNHKKVDYDALVAWTGQNQDFWKAKYPKLFDSHSIYLGALAERGVLGFLTLGLLLLAWIFFVITISRKKNMSDVELAIWGFSVSVLLLLMINGMFNSSFPFENGRLAFLGLGLMLSIFSLHRKVP